MTGSCEGTIELGYGKHTASVVVNDAATSCTDTETTNEVELFSPITVAATMTGTCQNKISYSASVSGGKGSPSYSWSFVKDGTTSLPGSTASSSTLENVAPGNYAGTVVVTEDRGDGVICAGSAQASAAAYSPLSVTVALKPRAPVCDGTSTDAVTYEARVDGGSGAPNTSYAWSGWTSDACSSGASCVIDPADNVFCTSATVSVNVTDSICGSTGSATKTYKKTTLIEADN